MRLGYPRLLREVAFFCAIRLSYSYLERLPMPVRLSSPIKYCMPIFRANRVYYYFVEKQPISVRIGYAVVM